MPDVLQIMIAVTVTCIHPVTYARIDWPLLPDGLQSQNVALLAQSRMEIHHGHSTELLCLFTGCNCSKAVSHMA